MGREVKLDFNVQKKDKEFDSLHENLTIANGFKLSPPFKKIPIATVSECVSNTLGCCVFSIATVASDSV